MTTSGMQCHEFRNSNNISEEIVNRNSLIRNSRIMKKKAALKFQNSLLANVPRANRGWKIYRV